MILAALGKVGTRQHLRRLTFPARTPELVSVFAAVVGVFWRFIRHARTFDAGRARASTLFGDFEQPVEVYEPQDAHDAPACPKQSNGMFFEPLAKFYKFAQERGIDVGALA